MIRIKGQQARRGGEVGAEGEVEQKARSRGAPAGAEGEGGIRYGMSGGPMIVLATVANLFSAPLILYTCATHRYH